jgi:signal transduction histidine kinase/CheY-like chemotaxis protein
MSGVIDRAFIRVRYLTALVLLGALSLTGLLFAERAARAYLDLTEVHERLEHLDHALMSVVAPLSHRVLDWQSRADVADLALLVQVDAVEADAVALAAVLAPFEPDAAARLLPGRRESRDLSAVLALARAIASADHADRAMHYDSYNRLLRLLDTLVLPQLHDLMTRLDARQQSLWRTMLARVELGAAALIAGLVATGFLIFLPMERRIVATQRALARETERAQDAERGKGAFLAAMSHEIRTSLSGVIGTAELLARTPLDGEQSRYVEIMRASGRALLRIINDILDYSKVAAGEMSLEMRPYDPVRALVDAAQLFAPAARAKGLSLALDLDPGTPRAAVGDAVRIGQVATNLLHNAVKFTDAGRIELSTAWRPETGVLRVAVADTGVGIPADKLETVFERFKQVDGASVERPRGTGLGLALAKSLIERMGGRVGVESRPGAGSTFWFEAPLRAPPGAKPFGQPVSGLKVALALGDARLAAALSRTLVAWGAEITAPDAAATVLVDAPAADRDAAGARVVAFAAGGAEAGSADAVVALPVDPDQLLRSLTPARRSAAAAAPDAAGERGDALAPGLRVLVADDNEVNRLIATRLLEGLGCVVAAAGDGVEALRMAAETRPDVILMDVSMPRMNGLEAAAEIRRREAGTGRRTPIVALTAHALAEHRERCLDAGMDDHLPKPFTPEALAATLARWRPAPARRGADRLAIA